jgi:hypothetical protein
MSVRQGGVDQLFARMRRLDRRVNKHSPLGLQHDPTLPFWRTSAYAATLPFANAKGLTDGVEKVRRDRSARNNRIVTADATNRYCCFGADLESMLLGVTGQLVFQQHRPFSAVIRTESKVRNG